MSARERTRWPGIYRRGSRYEVRTRHGSRGGFRTISAARAWKGDLDAGRHLPTGATRFGEHARRWVEAYGGRTARGVSPATRASYADSLERFAIPFFKAARLDDIDPPMVKRYVAHLAKRDLRPNSVRRHVAVVRALFADAVSDGLLHVNPTREVRVVVSDIRPAVDRRLSPAQTKALLAEMPVEHADLVYVLATAGVRISEALALTWGDIGMTDGAPTLTVRTSKTDAGRRTIRLTPEAAQRLTRRRSRALDPSPRAPVFPTIRGTHIEPCNFRRNIFKPAAVRAGVPDATPHWLRHGVASLMAAHGHGAADIAAHLGHADGGVLALRTYVHAAAPDVAHIDGALS